MPRKSPRHTPSGGNAATRTDGSESNGDGGDVLGNHLVFAGDFPPVCRIRYRCRVSGTRAFDVFAPALLSASVCVCGGRKKNEIERGARR